MCCVGRDREVASIQIVLHTTLEVGHAPLSMTWLTQGPTLNNLKFNSLAIWQSPL